MLLDRRPRDARRSSSTSSPPTARPAPAWPTRPRQRTARRASCRSAPGARSSTSAPPTTSASGAEIVLGNTYHLMLRPGAETIAALGGLGTVHRLARPDAHRLAAASRCSRSSPRSTTTASRSARTYDGSTPPLHARERRCASRSGSAPTSRWCSTCARRCRRRPTWSALARRAHRGVGRAGPRPRTHRGRPGAVRHRPGRHRRGAAGRERRSARSPLDFDGYGIGGLSVGESRGRDAAGARRRRSRDLPADRPRYLMGVGDPASLVEAVGARRRPVRLRAADPPRPPRHRPDRRPARLHLQATPSTPERRAARRRLRLRRSAPATPAATCATCSRWASRPRPAWSHPQPGLDAALDGPDARRDRGRTFGASAPRCSASGDDAEWLLTDRRPSVLKSPWMSDRSAHRVPGRCWTTVAVH